MINPTKITDFNRTETELQEFWLFGIMVAGKNADQTAAKLAKFLSQRGEQTPFEYLAKHETDLHNMLVTHKVGQYGRIERAIKQSLQLNLETATLEELEGIHGVGPKTARFFLLHTRPDAEVAVLDTHILRWLRLHSVDAPESTPSGQKYLNLEKIFLTFARAYYGNLTIARIDLLIWSLMSGRLDSYSY